MMKRPSGVARAIGGTVYRTMRETLNVPVDDNFQVIHEHDTDTLVFDKHYLGIERSDAIVVVQITLNEGRTLEMKKAFYAALARNLHDDHGLRVEDVFVSLVEVKKENWSFGRGLAQYAPAD